MLEQIKISKNGWNYEKAVCNDGFEVSIQASENHYCEPRENLANLDFYYRLELGFPNREDNLIMEYAETPSEPTETVYGYVPKSVVEALIEKHGGLKQEISENERKSLGEFFNRTFEKIQKKNALKKAIDELLD